jgi:hypothetical protein
MQTCKGVWPTGYNDRRTQSIYMLLGYPELFAGWERPSYNHVAQRLSHPYLARNSLYYPWFAVSHFVISLGYIYMFVLFLG